MNETWVTVVGNVATRPDYRETATGVPVARFRLAATARRWDRERAAWLDGPTSFYTVWAWRSLATNVTASVTIGEPLVVHGRLRIQERQEGQPPEHSREHPGEHPRERAWERPRERVAGRRQEEAAPRRRVTADIDAVSLGHDLSRGTSAFRRVSQAKPLLTTTTRTTVAGGTEICR